MSNALKQSTSALRTSDHMHRPDNTPKNNTPKNNTHHQYIKSDDNKKRQKRRILLKIAMVALCLLLIIILIGRQNNAGISTEIDLIRSEQSSIASLNITRTDTLTNAEIQKQRLQDLRMHNTLRDVSGKNKSLKENTGMSLIKGNLSATRNQKSDVKSVVEQWEYAFIHGESLP